MTSPSSNHQNFPPNGKHLGIIRDNQGEKELLIINTETMKATNQIYFTHKDDIARFSWVNNERVVISLQSKYRNHELKAEYGELYAMNIHEKSGKFIFGIRSLTNKKNLKKMLNQEKIERNSASAIVINQLPEDEDHILILAWSYSNKKSWIYKLNIFNGQTESISSF